MKRTLLDLTQSILSSLNSDEVNSISDTVESMQVANIIKDTYLNVIARIDFPEHNQLIQLNPSLDSTQPTMMLIPDGVGRIEWIKYFNSNILTVSTTSTHGINVNIVPSISWSTTSTTSNTIGTGTKTFTVTSSTLPVFIGQIITVTSGVNSMTGTVTSYIGTALIINVTATVGSGTFTSWSISAASTPPAPMGYQYVTILPIRQFLDMTASFNPNDSNVKSFVFTDTYNNRPGTFTFYYKNDRQPQYCTILSDHYVIFDAYDKTQDSTLQSSKTECYGEIIPSWQMVDSFIPNLDEEQFTLLLNEAKSLAFFELKQSPHPKAEQEAKRGWSSVQKDKSLIDRPSYFDQLANFGRKGLGARSSSSMFKSMGWDR